MRHPRPSAPGSADRATVTQVLQVDPNDCVFDDGTVCSQTYDWFDNVTVAHLAAWFIDRPLRIVLILLVAFVLTRVVRRWITRVINKVIASSNMPVERLERIGLGDKRLLQPVVKDPRREARATSVSVMLTSTVVVVIWVIALMMALSALGIDLAPLLAGAGIAGIALGFGAQSLVKDCIAGLFMLIEDQYGIGDVIDLGEARGTVEKISLRTTVLRSADGTVWHVPNGVVERVGNLSQLWSVAILDVDVAYDSDVGLASELLRQAAETVCSSEQHADQIVEPPEVLGVEALAADGVTLRLTVKVKPGMQWAIQRSLRREVKAAFDAANIEIPFPQRTVWMRAEGTGSRSESDAPEEE